MAAASPPHPSSSLRPWTLLPWLCAARVNEFCSSACDDSMPNVGTTIEMSDKGVHVGKVWGTGPWPVPQRLRSIDC